MSDDELREWTLEETIFFQNGKDKAFFHLFISDNPTNINLIKRDFAKVRNTLGVSRTKAIEQIFLVGLGAIAEKEDLELQLFDEKRLARLRKIYEIESRKQEHLELQRIRNTMSDEEWQGWCKETDHDASAYPSQFTIQVLNKTDRIRNFLESYLSSGIPKPTKEVKEAMIQSGIIDGEAGWNYARVIAERMGLIKEYGYWQL